MEQSDKDLIIECQEGNTEAFGLLYDRYFKAIYTFIYYRTRQKEVAEDLTSQTFFKALRTIQSVDSNRPFSSWLYKIAHNTIIDHFKTRKPTVDIEEAQHVSMDDIGAPEMIDTAQEVERLKKHLAHLAPIERDIIMMRIWQELSYREISEILDKTEASLKMMYSRAMKKLKSMIQG